MPELPEVETVCQVLKPVLEGRFFQTIQLNRPNLRYPLPYHMESTLAHHPILKVRRRAKYILIDLSHGLTLLWHLGMSGRVIIKNPSSACARLEPHDHIIFLTSHQDTIIYRDPRRFGFLLLFPTDQLDKVRFLHQLGPEPLDVSTLTAEAFHACFRHRLMSVKNALLDQRVIAGLGNIYVSEALWQARLSPLRVTNTITLPETEVLLEQIRDVLGRAIAAGGSTLRDHFRPDGHSGLFQHSFKVYKRENMLCGHCQINDILKIVQGGRSTYYCPYCQL